MSVIYNNNLRSFSETYRDDSTVEHYTIAESPAIFYT